MRNTRALIMIVIAALAGLVAVMLASQFLGERAAIGTKKVVVAATNIELGTTLSPEMLSEIDWPVLSVPEGAFSKNGDLLSDPGTHNPRIAKITILKGEPVLESKLAAAELKTGGLQAVLPPGKRAMTVRVNDVIGVSGFVQPGSYVDVVVTTEDEEVTRRGENKTISKIVLERMKVLAAAQATTSDPSKPKVVNAVTLEVTPKEAELLVLAGRVGPLTLVLRNDLDAAPVVTTGARKADLLKWEPPPVAAIPPQPAPVAAPAPAPEKKVVRRVVRAKPSGEKVEVIKGVEKTTHEIVNQ